MDDNACAHRAAEVSDILENENTEGMTCSANSPRLDRKEHASVAKSRCVSQRTCLPRIVQELTITLRGAGQYPPKLLNS
ncbi:hypothetical protein TNCV_1452881 [Trichonephila clavipes]|nr:hypothetical protein TNCV_1452881 [Trichonephila clavipes]